MAHAELVGARVVRSSHRILPEEVVVAVPVEDIEVVVVALDVEPVCARSDIGAVERLPVQDPFLLEDSGTHRVSGARVCQVAGGQDDRRPHNIDVLGTELLQIGGSFRVEVNTDVNVGDLSEEQESVTCSELSSDSASRRSSTLP